ncbi:MAG: (Fe-S)-binding protein [Candidatus Syntrophoarchaeum sp. GoM_oil]|nr:MAG: (Fe-S)-binding protein [Candidatus Syntrophoarchaeum sp. GoM_oil]
MVLEKRYLKWGNLCGKCNTCHQVDYHKIGEPLPICPSGSRFGYEAYFSSGKMEIVRALAAGEIEEPSERLLHIIYACTVCGGCTMQCKGVTTPGTPEKGIDSVDAFERVRREMVELGWGPLPIHKTIAENIESENNAYGGPKSERVTGLAKDLPEKGKIVYFIGCTSAYRRTELTEATVKILKASGLDVAVMRDEKCCGSPLLRTGQVPQAVELAAHNLNALKAAGAEKVVFSCAGCYRTFMQDYPKLIGEDLNVELVHISDLILDLIKDGKIKPTKEIKKLVTYHDPCHIGRHLCEGLLDKNPQCIYEQPREVIKSIPGLELVEMKRNRENAWCCGSGGGVKSAFPEFAVWTAKERIDEAKETGAEALVTSCPFCVTNLRDGAEGEMDVYDIVELIAESIEE